MNHKAALAIAMAASLALNAQEHRELSRFIGRTLSATVISVTDGDTVRARLEGTTRSIPVRLEGIDCPERGEPFAVQARNATRVMLFEKRVQIKATDVDRYDRLVGRIIVEGHDSSINLVESGLACHYSRYSSDALLAASQELAKNQGRGFWAVGAAKPACAKTSDIKTLDRLLTTPLADSDTGPFHGNRQSRLYHAPSCQNYRCRNCIAVFKSHEEAQKSGYRPAGDCLPQNR